MIKILIADDHPIVRAGLKQLIGETSDITVVGEAEDGFRVEQLLAVTQPDILVLDLSMPGRDGLDILKQVKPLYPNLQVLVLSMHAEDQYAIRVLKAGAAGYLNKNKAPEELIAAIRRVSTGHKYISAAVAERLAMDLDVSRGQALHELLSDREIQVLKLIASGRTISEIAGELFLSVKTISTYRSRVLQKLHLRTNAELTHYAIRNHLVN
ncbi:MAG: response regulator transcription factor [Candidatus Neomarinimicrobiota bacterium]